MISPAPDLVVGIGAPVGSIEALKQFFRPVPVDCGIAFVVVLHFEPDLHSAIVGILQSCTRMQVDPAADGQIVEAGHVYINRPDAVLTIDSQRLRLREAHWLKGEHNSIDAFFNALAEDLGENALGIVLSGVGSDGALGLKAIKLRNGIALAQGGDGYEPRYPDVPMPPIAMAVVDAMLPVEAMPARILAYARDRERTDRPFTEPELDTAAEGARLAICAILRERRGHDFSRYETTTLLRRVRHRMRLHRLATIDAYVDRLRRDGEEILLLCRDLSIGVTSFFHDPATFERIEQTVIPALFDGRNGKETVRVWVPGCATGEEVYSIAILMREHMDRLGVARRLQLFGTDIDHRAIAAARAGRYPTVLLGDMAPARRQHFFTAEDDSYVVGRDIRGTSVFSIHNILRDPPFSNLDLISCRNLLIYFNSDVRAQIIHAFHYALRPGGMLLLGNSADISQHADLFGVLDRSHGIFERLTVPRPTIVLPLVAPAEISVDPVPSPDRQADLGRSDLARAAEARILQRFAPAHVVVNSAGEALHYSSGIGKYIEPAVGAPSRDLLGMARSGLRAALREALRQAIETGYRVEKEHVTLDTQGDVQTIELVVEPLSTTGSDRLYLVAFIDSKPVRPPTAATTGGVPGNEEGPATHAEGELRDMRERLHLAIEESEAALEELQSSNEELRSVNEELQATNEELETSKENVQSVNEELQTVNQALTGKLHELDRANSDLRNAFEGTRIATIFLDRDMTLRSFTPPAAGIYNLIPADLGRPLTDIVSNLEQDVSPRDVRTVLDILEPVERRIARRDGKAHYLMRILPYRVTDGRTEGLLVTFVDVSTLVRAEARQRLLVEEMNHRVKNMLTVVISLATQSVKSIPTMEAFSEAFLGRLEGLARTYALVSRENWSETALRDLILDELLPHLGRDDANNAVDGPMVLLTPQRALALGMVLHELATNAVKHGAFSVPQGNVQVEWRIREASDGRWLAMHWTEMNGPEVAPPSRRGFGVELIEKSLSHELGGDAYFEYRPSGLRVRLDFPIAPAVFDQNGTIEKGEE